MVSFLVNAWLIISLSLHFATFVKPGKPGNRQGKPARQSGNRLVQALVSRQRRQRHPDKNKDPVRASLQPDAIVSRSSYMARQTGQPGKTSGKTSGKASGKASGQGIRARHPGKKKARSRKANRAFRRDAVFLVSRQANPHALCSRTTIPC